MRYDSTHGWLVTKADLKKAGFDDVELRNEIRNDKKSAIKSITSRACRNRPLEFVVKDMPANYQLVLQQHFMELGERHEETMVRAHAMGANITRVAVEVTAQTLLVNQQYVVEELRGYIESNYNQYTPWYLMAGLNGKSVIGYSKICALAQWAYNMVAMIEAEQPTERDRNRLMRSLRANLITALETGKVQMEVKVPTNDIRFSQWLDMVIMGMKAGKRLEEIIAIKRKGNVNPARLTDEQQKIVENLYIFGNAMPVQHILDKLTELGRLKGWWMESGEYKPVSYNTIRNHIKEHENRLELARASQISYFNNKVVQFSRYYPVNINYGWGIDGTAHNENVEHKGYVGQAMYAIKVFDYASMRLLTVATAAGGKEPAELVINTVKEAIRITGYKPYILQSDQGPAYQGLKAWCEEVGIHLLPAGVGRSRSKVVEALIGHVDNAITRYLQGFSGMNRTASGPNSRVSDAYFTRGKATARSLGQASEWVRKESVELWNTHIIQELEGQPCGKTPHELWKEKKSETAKLPFLEIARLAAVKNHTVRLNNDGAEIQNNGHKYTYFPLIGTPEQQAHADEVFARIPRGDREGSQVTIQIVEYGKKAPVYYKNQFLGIWEQVKRVPYFATFEGDTADYNNMRALQNLQIDNARKKVEETRQALRNHPDEEKIIELASTPLTGRRRLSGQYDKEDLNAFEMGACDNVEPEAIAVDKVEYKTLVDPDTGETYYIPINNLNNG
ncbi:MAG: transposase family protein [Bacteroidales bacterium]|nr:transposase family protein [Bacteroidales bacterium]MDD3666713.1 transposase family protein [Bacteroidales bacterium]